jgi:hypothetical protein
VRNRCILRPRNVNPTTSAGCMGETPIRDTRSRSSSTWISWPTSSRPTDTSCRPGIASSRCFASSPRSASISESSPTIWNATRLPRSWRQNWRFSCTVSLRPAYSGNTSRRRPRTCATLSSFACPSFRYTRVSVQRSLQKL